MKGRARLFVAVADRRGAPARDRRPRFSSIDQQILGRRLFDNLCGVCHTRPTLIAGMYGPELSRETAGGQEEVVRGIVTNGTPRMPGFKYTFNAEQIAAIAAYLRHCRPAPGHQPCRPQPGLPANQIQSTIRSTQDYSGERHDRRTTISPASA